MVFCNCIAVYDTDTLGNVTILILIDGFLQYLLTDYLKLYQYGHNPYFNRWFSAILVQTQDFSGSKESQSLF